MRGEEPSAPKVLGRGQERHTEDDQEEAIEGGPPRSRRTGRRGRARRRWGASTEEEEEEEESEQATDRCTTKLQDRGKPRTRRTPGAGSTTKSAMLQQVKTMTTLKENMRGEMGSMRGEMGGMRGRLGRTEGRLDELWFASGKGAVPRIRKILQRPAGRSPAGDVPEAMDEDKEKNRKRKAAEDADL